LVFMSTLRSSMSSPLSRDESLFEDQEKFGVISLRKNVLFVDDEPTLRQTVPPHPDECWFRRYRSATVSEALCLINLRTFDVLSSDLNIGEAAVDFYGIS
jgi:hypothetical protein